MVGLHTRCATYLFDFGIYLIDSLDGAQQLLGEAASQATDESSG